MIYPQDHTTIGTRIMNSLFSSDKSLLVPSDNEILKQSLSIFLTKQEKILKELEFTTISQLNLPRCINSIYHIFEQLYYRHISHGNSYHETLKTASLVEVSIHPQVSQHLFVSFFIGV